MSDNPRIQELRRRVEKDPASIAFAQLAEEFRRAGDYEQAVRVCRTGLAKHPSYLSARVTLGRALIELGQFDEAQTELHYVLRSAPENLAAIRGMAEIHQRRGDLVEALRQYQTALGIAKHDPDLEESVTELARQVGPEKAAAILPPPGAAAAPEPAPVAPPPPIPFDFGSSDVGGSGDQALPPPLTHAAAPQLQIDAAADEFTKALQALDALSLDTPEFDPQAARQAEGPQQTTGFEQPPQVHQATAPVDEPPEAASETIWSLPSTAAPFEGALSAIDQLMALPDLSPEPAGGRPDLAAAPEDAASADTPRDPALEELESWLNALTIEQQDSDASHRS